MLNFQGCWSEIRDTCLVDKGKLDTYFTFKTSYNYENYLDINNIEKRTMLTKFRLSNHCLKIETGRHEHITNISGKQEILPRCVVLLKTKYISFWNAHYTRTLEKISLLISTNIIIYSI